MSMKFKHLLITILLVFTLIKSFADPIDEATAKTVALNFLKSKTNSNTLPNTTSLDLVYKNDFDHITCYYVFNTNNLGFIIISGDDVVLPVLGYSDESNFEINEMPIQVRKWLDGYQKQIVFAVKNRLIQTEEIEIKWDELKNNFNLTQSNTARPMAVAPLVQTRWGQDPYENALCPYDYTYNAQTVTGCPATAMAQIMKYWNYPTNGTGFHSFSHQSYGTLSANFGSTNYQWSSMPNIISSSNNAVATLMYHCGVAVEMNYGVAQTGGSGSYVIISASPTPQQSSEYAFKTYFGYNPSTIQGLMRSNYSDINWINLLKNELNNGRPIQYAGFGSGGGHTWVCDGYDNNNYFNMNWGWGAGINNCNGFYLLNALNPGTLGTGGGTGGFSGDQQALIGIQPPSSPVTYNLALYNTVTPSSNPIYYGNAFTITTNIANNGTNTFSGDYCAAVFDAQYNFIDYVQTLSNYTLQGGFAYTNNLVFQNTGLFSMLPGNYYVGIFYRPTGGNWTIVSNSGSYTNLIPISVINSNPIRLNSAISITPSTLVEGQSASANLNIINNGTSTFIGQYQLNLYKLDGTFVQTINTVNENNGLPPGYTYGSPYWTFTTTSITATPGTYLMAALYKSSSSTSWSLTGNGNFQNPVRVIVQAAPPQPDQYETNNTSAQSYSLSPNFINNTSVLNTTGSNIHVASDNDYYKINLPSGNNYTITARLHDSYNSGNGILYTGDVLFSYSTDGTTWSSSYDDIMPNNISFNSGGTIYFHVAPYFAGNTGTYLLDISISRTVCPTASPTPTGNVTSCSGNPIVLTSNNTTGNQWYLNGSAINGATSNTFTPLVSGSYTLVSTNNGCASNQSNSTTITITPSPSSPSISWNGSQFSTTATGVTYQWYLNGTAIAGATSPTFTPTSIGVYKVMVTSNGCSSSSDNYTLVVTGIDPTLILSAYTALVYPNPAKNDFVIKFGETPDVTLDIQLVNNLGVVLKSQKTKSNLTTVKINDLPAGIYFIKIIGGSYNQVKKIEVIK